MFFCEIVARKHFHVLKCERYLKEKWIDLYQSKKANEKENKEKKMA